MLGVVLNVVCANISGLESNLGHHGRTRNDESPWVVVSLQSFCERVLRVDEYDCSANVLG